MRSSVSVAQRLTAWIKTLALAHVFLGVVFLVSSLLLNVFQALVYFGVRPFSRRLYRRINYYLIYASWSQVVALTQRWSGSRCKMWGSPEDLKKFGKEHALVIMNHKYELDWLLCWIICEQLCMLASAKSFAKSSLKYIPAIGWNWALSEHIFLERNWEKDSKILGGKLDDLVEYEQNMLLLLFCEGTRFTKEKHKLSMEFAEKKNLQKLKHHLLPRPKGFVFCAKHLKGKTNAIYDIQVGFPDGPNPPSLKTIINGRKLSANMYVRRIPMEDIPTDSEEECTQFLYDMYQHKDKVMDDYLKTGKFPGIEVDLPVRIWPLLNWIAWCLIIGIPFMYGLYAVFTSGNTYVIGAAVTAILLVYTGLRSLVGITEIKKSSSYGSSPDSKHSKNGPLANQNENIHSTGHQSENQDLRKDHKLLNGQRLDS